ncbi:MAG TPA: HNH endonuclease signature motif containing protein, partial [Polyangiaceae bacterium]|nr:HNH endonuclease signature motif containing protein [Polyangiaceae bacterium]
MASAAVIGFEDVHADVSWRRAHKELVRLSSKRAGLDFEEGRWLLRAFRSGAHRELGYGSFHEYTERLFGYAPRLTHEKLRVAEALEALPGTAEELKEGTLSFSAVRELTRVAIPATEREWLRAARGRTVREVEELVSGHRAGSRPGDVPDASAKRHVLRFDISGEALASFREAMAKIRREAGEALDDDAAILLLSRSVLEGTRDEARSSYQVALTVCERCRQGRQPGRGELVQVSQAVVDMAECDGQHLGHLETSVEPRAHVGTAKKRRRATQTIPPALRRQVLRRDGGRCQVPGCRHATFVDVHHLRPRSEGGANTLENLVTLCGAHHRASHAGKLSSEGAPSEGLTFLHADGTPYGHAPSPAIAELRARAYRALTHLGFRESEA